MGSLFSKPKTVKSPLIASPGAVPVVSPGVEEEAMKKMRKRYGFEKTILTGQLVPVSTGKKTTLG